MASIKGTAANYLDLAAKIKDFLTTGLGDRNWRILRESNGAVEYDAPGLTGKEHIYLSIEPVADAPKDHYYFALRGSIAFIEGNPIHGQPSGVTAYTPLINAPMNYWISANGQRAIIVVRVASVYMLMYLGKFLPYATPSQYPYPMIVAGMTINKDLRYSSGMSLSSIHKPNGGQVLFSPNNSPIYIKNNPSNSEDFAQNALTVNNLSKPINNKKTVLLPVIIFTSTRGGEVYGELDGLMIVSGFGVKSEDILSDNDKKFMVFQNASNTGFSDFYVMEWQNV